MNKIRILILELERKKRSLDQAKAHLLELLHKVRIRRKVKLTHPRRKVKLTHP